MVLHGLNKLLSLVYVGIVSGFRPTCHFKDNIVVKAVLSI